MAKPNYDTTHARSAGNVASGLVKRYQVDKPAERQQVAAYAVEIAVEIIKECQKWQPREHPAQEG
jgi:hypothetical protein